MDNRLLAVKKSIISKLESSSNLLTDFPFRKLRAVNALLEGDILGNVDADPNQLSLDGGEVSKSPRTPGMCWGKSSFKVIRLKERFVHERIHNLQSGGCRICLKSFLFNGINDFEIIGTKLEGSLVEERGGILSLLIHIWKKSEVIIYCSSYGLFLITCDIGFIRQYWAETISVSVFFVV
ncbi:hypothetical protein M1K46_24750 [Fictibacillus sp. WQ 8-8]|nr:hypothetical protein [Fictibacillus sp. WQ 8-8]